LHQHTGLKGGGVHRGQGWDQAAFLFWLEGRNSTRTLIPVIRVNRQRVPGQSVAKSPEAEVCVRIFLESLTKNLSVAKENLRRHSAAEHTQHFGHILSEDFSFLSPGDHLTVKQTHRL
ncbi:hypothetical protein KUCAC02_033874, partial [Chaenocephalus aceratus]